MRILSALYIMIITYIHSLLVRSIYNPHTKFTWRAKREKLDRLPAEPIQCMFIPSDISRAYEDIDMNERIKSSVIQVSICLSIYIYNLGLIFFKPLNFFYKGLYRRQETNHIKGRGGMGAFS
jgi:hypothetical protein